ncbi:MAG: transposase [Desulfobacteraceae bacterium]|nr:transposase [Desulfobacteraceae bacterium]
MEKESACWCCCINTVSDALEVDTFSIKFFNRVVLECEPEKNGINLKLIEHISPITWDNVILYGEYRLNHGLIEV